MPKGTRVRLLPVKQISALDHATHSKIPSLTLSAGQSFSNLMRRVIIATNHRRRTANGLFLERDGHGEMRSAVEDEIEAEEGEISVPRENSQITEGTEGEKTEKM
jgi:hypothetical protein